MDDWQIVVAPHLPAIADNLFDEWKLRNPEIAARLEPADIRMDLIRSPSGELKRYSIRLTGQSSPA